MSECCGDDKMAEIPPIELPDTSGEPMPTPRESRQQSGQERIEFPVDVMEFPNGEQVAVDAYGLYLDSRDIAMQITASREAEMEALQKAGKVSALAVVKHEIHKAILAAFIELVQKETGVTLNRSWADYLYDQLEQLQIRKKKARRDDMSELLASAGFMASTLPD